MVEHLPRIREDKAGAAVADDDFEQWLERLPFPLASILWRYYADEEPGVKNAHLFNFFEAHS